QYIHTNTYIQIHTYKYIHTNTYIQIHTYKYIHTNTYIQIHTYRHTEHGKKLSVFFGESMRYYVDYAQSALDIIDRTVCTYIHTYIRFITYICFITYIALHTYITYIT